MNIGYVGLGKMGLAMVARLRERGHAVVAYDPDERARRSAQKLGAETASSLEALVESLSVPRALWLMVPHEAVGEVMAGLALKLAKGDLVIDGGNSPYEHSMVRARALAERGVQMLDVGVSGGPDGARRGASLMVGGGKAAFERARPLLADLAAVDGLAHVGPSGAGHFAKMVHNGIEYGMMQALAEGFAVLRAKGEFKFRLAEVARVYGHGSVIESRLVGWLHEGLTRQGSELAKAAGCPVGTGEGDWTVRAAKELGVGVPVIAAAVRARKACPPAGSYIGRVIMTLRHQFGGHGL
jgi:6-phosphogluconate dehydrogenase